jgi:hypothetical protein
MYLEVVKTSNGYILQTNDKTTKYILNSSKKTTGNYAPYYLKQVAPQNKYISGMFKDKKSDKFNGKLNIDSYNFKVRVLIYNNNLGKIEFLPY